MKVILAIPCLFRGGTEMQTLMLAKVLRELGYKVIVVCYFEFDHSMVSEFIDSGVEVRLPGLKRKVSFLNLVQTLRCEFRNINPEIIHIQYMAPGALPVLAARIAGIKTIFATVHQPYTKSHKIISRIILRTASLFTSSFIAVSLNAEKSWFGTSSLFSLKIPVKKQLRHFTIYNAVDTDAIQRLINNLDINTLKRTLRIPEGKLVIGTISRLRNEKGIDLLIEAFSSLLAYRRDVHLLIVGSGPDEISLKASTDQLQLSSQVTFTGEAGWHSAMEYLALMDIVIVPSRFEGFGLTAAEASAAGKPIIVSDVFGLREVIEDKETGLMFSSGDTNDLLIKLLDLINHPTWIQEFASRGKERVNSMFSKEIFKEKVNYLYSSF